MAMNPSDSFVEDRLRNEIFRRKRWELDGSPVGGDPSRIDPGKRGEKIREPRRVPGFFYALIFEKESVILE